MITTSFNFERVSQITEYHRSNKKWKFTLTKCDDDRAKREDFMGLKLENKNLLPGYEKWAPLALNHATSRNFKYDVVVCDVMCPAGSLIADQSRIPLVVNVPGTLETLEFLSDVNFMSTRNSCPCCGCLCVC